MDNDNERRIITYGGNYTKKEHYPFPFFPKCHCTTHDNNCLKFSRNVSKSERLTLAWDEENKVRPERYSVARLSIVLAVVTNQIAVYSSTLQLRRIISKSSAFGSKVKKLLTTGPKISIINEKQE